MQLSTRGIETIIVTLIYIQIITINKTYIYIYRQNKIQIYDPHYEHITAYLLAIRIRAVWRNILNYNRFFVSLHITQQDIIDQFMTEQRNNSCNKYNRIYYGKNGTVRPDLFGASCDSLRTGCETGMFDWWTWPGQLLNQSYLWVSSHAKKRNTEYPNQVLTLI